MAQDRYLLLRGKWNTFIRHFKKQTVLRLHIWHRRTSKAPLRKIPYDTFYHCCTQKTASQWFRRILEDPVIYEYTGLQSWPYISIGLTQAGKVRPLPTGTFGTHYYINHSTFKSMKKPDTYRAFFILRDPRDIVVSWYFSARFSHPFIGVIPEMRLALEKMDQQSGMKYIIDKIDSFGTFDAQLSWLMAEKQSESIKIFRYEDLIEDNAGFLQKLFDYLEIRIPNTKTRKLAERYSFEKITKGRIRGTENIYRHNRKGVSGDWKNYFDDDIYGYFRKRTGNLIERVGYN